MHHVTFDRYVRRAAGLLDRRSVLTGGGGALLAATSGPFAVEAKKGKKKIGKKKRKECKKRAKFCREDFHLFCETDSPPGLEDECLAIANACCKKLATCRFNGEEAIACLDDGIDGL